MKYFHRSEQHEKDLQEDAAKRVSLSAANLPSICFYTFFPTHRTLNTVEISRDGRMVAGGFADSSVRLWDMNKSPGKSKEKENVYKSVVCEQR